MKRIRVPRLTTHARYPSYGRTVEDRDTTRVRGELSALRAHHSS